MAVMSVQQALALGRQHFQAGRWQAAEQVCRAVLQIDPEQCQPYALLAAIACRAGNYAEAAGLLHTAIAIDQASAACHNDLSMVLATLGRFAEAEAAARQALALDPDFAGAWYNLAGALFPQGRLTEAEQAYRRTLELRPDFSLAANNLGNLLHLAERFSEAESCYRRALALDPAHAHAAYNLGGTLVALARPQEAVAAYRQALTLRPAFPEAENNLGSALRAQGRLDEALDAYRRALALRPDFFDALANRARLLQTLGRMDEAQNTCRRALAVRPDSAEVQNMLGSALRALTRQDEAEAAYRRAIALGPDLADAWHNLGSLLQNQGWLDEADDCFRQALRLRPDLAAADSSLLMSAQYRCGAAPAELAAQHAAWDRRHAAGLLPAEPPHAPRRDPQQPLRLGFVSPDLGFHPVGTFIVRFLEALDRRQAETYCYSDRTRIDDMTHRIRAASTAWRDVRGLGDEDLARQIRDDRIDVLFDLAGHTGGNRLLVFARRPAPLAVTWLGYVGTTGLSAMDYLIADRYQVPPGAEPHYREKVLRLPDGYVCYDPPGDAPPVGPLPAALHGQVTFGSFNNPAKVTHDVARLWAEILRRVPGARLVLKSTAYGAARTAERVRQWFAAEGISAGRIELRGWSPHRELLAAYHEIDLALDPFPYSGGLTTCEALWMGVPVITCPGATFAGRHSLSHLSNAGLGELVAGDLSEYAGRAVELAGDLPRLAALRGTLRPQVAGSPLCDGNRFAANLMALLRDIQPVFTPG
jgi:predicted O-linked N-acetylglucosamine transferase (SPINDLY family)